MDIDGQHTLVGAVSFSDGCGLVSKSAFCFVIYITACRLVFMVLMQRLLSTEDGLIKLWRLMVEQPTVRLEH